MRESAFWKYLREGMKKTWLADRIETGTTKAGVPDVFYAIDGSCGWIELKMMSSMPRDKTSKMKTKVSALQLHWLRTRAKEGVTTWMFFQCALPKSYYLTSMKYLNSHSLTKDFVLNNSKIWENRIDFNELAEILQNGTL
jgi:hypothetical protein